jgi:hypothetical protein
MRSGASNLSFQRVGGLSVHVHRHEAEVGVLAGGMDGIAIPHHGEAVLDQHDADLLVHRGPGGVFGKYPAVPHSGGSHLIGGAEVARLGVTAALDVPHHFRQHIGADHVVGFFVYRHDVDARA